MNAAVSGHRALGMLVALGSAAAFGTAGTFGAAIMQAGWSPAATVATRLVIGGLALAPLALWQLRGRYATALRNWRTLLLFGLAGCAGTQMFYFLAIVRLPVGVALLIEYLAPVLVVGWVWLTTRVRPTPMVGLGTVLALGGLLLVLDVFGNLRIDLIGVALALAAAACLACYFVSSADDSIALPPIALASGGLLVGAAAVGAVGALGLLPMRTSAEPVMLFGESIPVWAALASLGLIAGAVAYLSGIVAARQLGARLASFVGLTEVIFAVGWAWLAIGQSLRPIQLIGGLVIVVGVAVVRAAEPTQRPVSALTSGGQANAR